MRLPIRKMYMEGKTINGFELKRLLGVGGMAEVWYAENEIGKPAAVKILNEDLSHNAQIVDRFRNEAVVMVKLDHNNIRQVYGYGTIDGRPSIVMEYLEGDDLKAMMKQGRRFNNDELVKWWNQLVDALNYTHAQGIVHRDIKPSNIFLDKKGNIKLLDFGIAKIRESISITHTGAMLGTLMYMSPEQVDDAKHLGPQSDIYSLAVTFVHLLTGKAPYDSTTMSDFKIRESIVYKPLDLSGVPTEWQDFLTPYLAKEPEKRPALRPFNASVPENRRPDSDDATVSNEELRTARPNSTSTFSDNTPTIDRHSGLDPLSPKPKDKPKKTLWIALAAAAVAALVAVLVMNNKGGNAPIPAEVTAVEEHFSNGGDLTINANGVNITMKFVQGGTFQMGSNDSEAYDWEQPVHNVTVSSFYMAETEVTQALWKAVMGGNNNPSYFKGDNLPVEQVSWNDCQEFIRKLNNLTGKNFRLPTEAEWEFAARGGTQTSLYNGENIVINGVNNSPNLDRLAWYGGNCGRNYTSSAGCDITNGYDISGWNEKQYADSKGGTHPVRQKQPNAYGLYDMLGNVWEWCQDWYGDYGSSLQTNPQGPSSGSYRVLRGGSWGSYARLCRVSNRINAAPDIRYGDYGFRLALPQ